MSALPACSSCSWPDAVDSDTLRGSCCPMDKELALPLGAPPPPHMSRLVSSSPQDDAAPHECGATSPPSVLPMAATSAAYAAVAGPPAGLSCGTSSSPTRGRLPLAPPGGAIMPAAISCSCVTCRTSSGLQSARPSTSLRNARSSESSCKQCCKLTPAVPEALVRIPLATLSHLWAKKHRRRSHDGPLRHLQQGKVCKRGIQ